MRIITALLFLCTLAWAQRITPGDALQFYCELEPSLSVNRIVSDAGTIELPILGRYTAGGKFVAEIESEVSQLAAAKLRSENLRVLVSLVGKETSLIEFSGAVTKAGAIAYHEGMTIEEVYRAAQPSGSAALEAVEVQSADGKKVVINVGTTEGLNYRLRKGDRVFFPLATEANEVFILGAVAHPGSVKFKEGMTLRDLIESGGGLTGHAESSSISIVRKDGSKLVGDISPSAPETLLQRGDAVSVSLAKTLRYVTVRGYVSKPGTVEYFTGMKLSDVIREAGGILLLGRSDKVVVRRVGEVPYWTKEFNLNKIYAKQAEDPEIRPSDIIEVLQGEFRPIGGSKPSAKPVGGHPVVPPR